MSNNIIKDLADIRTILDKYGAGASKEFEITFNLNETCFNKLESNIVDSVSDDMVIYFNGSNDNQSIYTIYGIKIIINKK